MQIARFWSKFAGTADRPNGLRVPFVCWRGSPTSESEAQELARQAGARMTERIEQGEGFPERYLYPGRPLREELLEEFPGASGELAAAITRNAYGAEVLNAARVFFIDVDFAATPKPAATSFWQRLLQAIGMGTPAPAMSMAEGDAVARSKRHQWLLGNAGWGMRVYRTKSGFRYLVTHAPFEPGGAPSEAAMEFLGCDPNYRLLCRTQKSFRARLTPKPWRLGAALDAGPGHFPWETPSQQDIKRDWVRDYDETCKKWATCAFVESAGNPAIHPEVAAFVKLHDDRTKAASGLPLA